MALNREERTSVHIWQKFPVKSFATWKKLKSFVNFLQHPLTCNRETDIIRNGYRKGLRLPWKKKSR